MLVKSKLNQVNNLLQEIPEKKPIYFSFYYFIMLFMQV